jgi:GTP-binding protein HflX
VTGDGLETLRDRMAEKLRRGEEIHEISLAAAQGDKIAWLHARGEVLDQKLREDEVQLSVRLSPENWARFQSLVAS